MITEKEILICYDIENNKTRKKLRDALKAIGMFSIQKSVMWGTLNNAEINAAKRILKDHTNKETDRAFLIEVSFLKKGIEFSIGHDTSFKIHKENAIII